MRMFKLIKIFWHTLILYLTLLKLLSITSADKSNTTAMSNESSKSFDKNLSFFYDPYTLSKAAINDTVIRLENTSLLLTNAIVIGSKILASGKMDYSVLIENSVFENSEIVIDQ